MVTFLSACALKTEINLHSRTIYWRNKGLESNQALYAGVFFSSEIK